MKEAVSLSPYILITLLERNWAVCQLARKSQEFCIISESSVSKHNTIETIYAVKADTAGPCPADQHHCTPCWLCCPLWSRCVTRWPSACCFTRRTTITSCHSTLAPTKTRSFLEGSSCSLTMGTLTTAAAGASFQGTQRSGMADTNIIPCIMVVNLLNRAFIWKDLNSLGPIVSLDCYHMAPWLLQRGGPQEADPGVQAARPQSELEQGAAHTIQGVQPEDGQ